MDLAREFASDAFDAVAALGAVNSLDELASAAVDQVRPFGVEVVGAGITPRLGESRVELLFGNLDHPWARHYVDAGWSKRGPIISRAAGGQAPVFWSDLQGAAADPARRLFSEAVGFGIRDGHVMLAPRSNGQVMVVATAAGAVLDDPRARLAVHLITLHFGMVGFELRENARGAEEPAPRLTERQIECLRWVRDGKSAWEIGAILGVSARTVEEHLNKACRALGVHTRMQAVLEGARLGLVAL